MKNKMIHILNLVNRYFDYILGLVLIAAVITGALHILTAWVIGVIIFHLTFMDFYSFHPNEVSRQALEDNTVGNDAITKLVVAYVIPALWPIVVAHVTWFLIKSLWIKVNNLKSRTKHNSSI